MKVTLISYKHLIHYYQRISKLITPREYFKDHLGETLYDVDLEFAVEDLSEYEYMIMKRLGYDVTPFEWKGTFYSEEKNSRISLLLKESVMQLEEPLQGKIDFKRYFSPSFYNKGNCIVSFTGNDLAIFMNNNPLQFFSTITGGKCTDQKDAMTEEDSLTILNSEFFDGYVHGIHNTEIEDNLILYFVKKFYMNMLHYVQTTDILSDFYLKDDFDQITDPVDVYSVSSKEIHPDRSIIFTAKSSFATYFQLLNLLPRDSIITTTPLLGVRSNTELSLKNTPSELYGYLKENKETLKSIKSAINKLEVDHYVVKGEELSWFTYTYNYAQIKYIFKIKMSEVEGILLTYKNLYEKSNDVSVIELKCILNLIKETYFRLKGDMDE